MSFVPADEPADFAGYSPSPYPGRRLNPPAEPAVQAAWRIVAGIEITLALAILSGLSLMLSDIAAAAF